MTFTLYVQYHRGKQVQEPKKICGVSLSSDVEGKRVYAFVGDRLVNDLNYSKVTFSRDGVYFSGIEKIAKADATIPPTFYLQEWWCAY